MIRKRLVFIQNRTSFPAWRCFKYGSRSSATFKMKLFAAFDNVRVYNQYLHVVAVTRPSLQAKLKSDEKGHVLMATSDTIYCFVDIFSHFF